MGMLCRILMGIFMGIRVGIYVWISVREAGCESTTERKVTRHSRCEEAAQATTEHRPSS